MRYQADLPAAYQIRHSDYYLVATAEASANLARFDGVHYGYRAEHAETLSAMYRNSRDQGFGAEVSGGFCWAPTRSRQATTTRITAKRSRCGDCWPRSSCGRLPRWTRS